MFNLYFLAILILGDSHCVGQPGEMLKKELNKFDHDIVIMCQIGESAKSLSKKKKHFEADLNIIFLGTNDVYNIGTKRAYHFLKSKYDNAVVIGPPSFKDVVLNRNAVKVAAVQYRIFRNNWIDSMSCDLDFLHDYARDGIHLNKKGAQNWSKCIIKELINKKKIIK